MVEIDAAALRECIRLKGGNAKGIFIHEILEPRNSGYVASLLRPGLRLMKVSIAHIKSVTTPKSE